MNKSANPSVADEARDTYRKTAAQFEELARAAPETMRDLATKNLAQTREFYERSKDAFEGVLDSWERTFGAAGRGAFELNRKVIDIAQRNINSGFDLMNGLVGAENLGKAMELQAAHWRKQLDALTAQAEEVRELSIRVTSDAAEPLKEQATRGMDELHEAH
jgi:phasin